jgi:hypothetical protein
VYTLEHEWFNTLEEFIEWEIKTNKGSSTTFRKETLIDIFKECYPNEKVKSTMTKGDMLSEILKKKSLLDIYEEYKYDAFGIKPYNWIEKFGLTPSYRKKMEKEEFLLHVMYYSYEKVFTGTYANVPYYRAEDYFNHTEEEDEKWKEDNIRGYKKRKENLTKEGCNHDF